MGSFFLFVHCLGECESFLANLTTCPSLMTFTTRIFELWGNKWTFFPHFASQNNNIYIKCSIISPATSKIKILKNSGETKFRENGAGSDGNASRFETAQKSRPTHKSSAREISQILGKKSEVIFTRQIKLILNVYFNYRWEYHAHMSEFSKQI